MDNFCSTSVMKIFAYAGVQILPIPKPLKVRFDKDDMAFANALILYDTEKHKQDTQGPHTHK